MGHVCFCRAAWRVVVHMHGPWLIDVSSAGRRQRVYSPDPGGGEGHWIAQCQRQDTLCPIACWLTPSQSWRCRKWWPSWAPHVTRPTCRSSLCSARISLASKLPMWSAPSSRHGGSTFLVLVLFALLVCSLHDHGAMPAPLPPHCLITHTCSWGSSMAALRPSDGRGRCSKRCWPSASTACSRSSASAARYHAGG